MRFATRSLAVAAAALALVSFVTAVRLQVAAETAGVAAPAHAEPVALAPLTPVTDGASQLAQYFELELEEVIPVPARSPETAPAPSVSYASDVTPLRIRIPAIDVEASMVDLGLRQDGTLHVPWDFEITGWYAGRAVPGEVGPSVVVGHFDSTEGPAVFYDLRELEPGDVVEVDRDDGLVAYFRVTESEYVDKDEFPTERVYGATQQPTLRLITCSGRFDREDESYPGNLVVFAEHLGNQPAGSLTY